MPDTYVSVAVPLPVTGTFTYLVPEEFASAVSVGVRVLVPFGRRKLTGFVVAKEATSDIAHVKAILDVLDVDPVVGPRMIELTRWIADYYMAPWGEVLRAALPPGINMESRRFVRITDEGREALDEGDSSLPERRRLLLEAAAKREKVTLGLANREAGVPRGQSTDVLALASAGLVDFFEEVLPPSVAAGTEAVIRFIGTSSSAQDAADKLARRAPKQAHVLKLLADSESGTVPVADLSQAGISSATVTRLTERGLVERTERSRPRLSVGMEGWDLGEEGPLKPQQEEALAAIRAKMDAQVPAVFLLHGVTGSGKTRVYSETIRAALESGKSAIILVPEISLTPQMVQRMKLEFGERVAVIHSGLSLGERYDTWNAIRRGQFPVVIGPRSAVFAPVRDLGVIIVDEEHEQTYKQSESPRYHARDVATMRARLEGALVILGTATPSLESYLNARDGKYELVELPERIDAGPLPEVEIVDMRETETVDSEGIFSATLRDAISETLDCGRQVILFLNRRGFASFVQCMDCGHSVRCDDCNVSMTYHSTGKLMRCHYCGRTGAAPDSCSECGSINLRFGAPGTQRVEPALAELFPDAVVQRMDQDTTSRHGSHWRILKEFASGKIDILLGTQMIAKGLDFPGVGLVGVVAADVGLNLPDFRAGERTFQLLTQVAGRTGRGGTRGKVIVQTYLPDHYTISLAQTQHFESFFKREIAERQGLGLGYPPHSRLVSVVIRGRDEQQVMKAAARLADFLEKGAGQMPEPQPEVLGPAPAPLERIKGTYRWLVVVRGIGGSARTLISAAMEQKAALKLPSGVQLVVDVDPLDLL